MFRYFLFTPDGSIFDFCSAPPTCPALLCPACVSACLIWPGLACPAALLCWPCLADAGLILPCPWPTILPYISLPYSCPHHTWVRLNFLFDSTQFRKILIRLNWSWLTVALQEVIQISSQLKMDFWSLIQVCIWIKNLWILNRINSWLNDSNQLLISLACFWAFIQFHWPFLDFHWIELVFCWAFDSGALIRISCFQDIVWNALWMEQAPPSPPRPHSRAWLS